MGYLNFIFDILLLYTFIYAQKYASKFYFNYYIGFVVIVEILGLISLNFNIGKYVNLLNNLYPLMSIVYFASLLKGKTGKYDIVIIITSLLFIILCVVSLFSQGIHQLSTYAVICFILFNFSSMPIWFISQLNSPTIVSITKKFLFWICASLLFWSAYYIFRIIPMYYLNSKDKNFLDLLAYGNKFINILCYLLFLRGILCLKQKDYLSN